MIQAEWSLFFQWGNFFNCKRFTVCHFHSVSLPLAFFLSLLFRPTHSPAPIRRNHRMSLVTFYFVSIFLLPASYERDRKSGGRRWDWGEGVTPPLPHLDTACHGLVQSFARVFYSDCHRCRLFVSLPAGWLTDCRTNSGWVSVCSVCNLRNTAFTLQKPVNETQLLTLAQCGTMAFSSN